VLPRPPAYRGCRSYKWGKERQHSKPLFAQANGKVSRTGTSQKTCQVDSIIQSFRVKGKECKMSYRQFIFQLYSFFSEGSFNHYAFQQKATKQ